MESNPLILLIAVPLGIAIVNLVLPVVLRKILTFLGLVYGLYLAIVILLQPVSDVMLFGTTVFTVDNLAAFIVLFIHIMGLLILIFSIKGIQQVIEKSFFVLYPFTIAFCNGVALSDHIISFVLFWGLSGLTLYLFALLGRTDETSQTAKKTLIIIGGSDAFLIMGLVLLHFIQPSAGWSLDAMSIPFNESGAILAFVLLLIGAFAKAGGVPLHTWVPDFSKDAPVEGTAFLPASMDKLIGIYLLARIMMSLFEVPFVAHMVVITLGALSVITAVMMALVQHNGRKLLGYHAVSQVGYMIMGIGSGSVLAFAGGLFHMINNVIYKTGLFLTLGSVEKQTGTNNLEDLGGLGKVMPMTFLAALIGALSISGIPPFNGFFSKWMIYQGLLETAASLTAGYQIWLLVCIILAIFGSALTLASFLKFIHTIYLGKRPEKLSHIRETSSNQWIATGLIALVCVIFGLFALSIPLGQFIYPAITEAGWNAPDFLGMYQPQLVIVLFAVAFGIGMLVYFLTKNVRYAETYLGGVSAEERFRVVGTEFYNEIRNMTPLHTLYDAAEKKFFDIYDVGAKSTIGLAKLFQKGHPGQLQLYLLYIVLGFLIFLWVAGV
ncbi:MAG TPA: proton-conducting transporter membrane subunit [bacterium]|nr:proton-conducting transporter membrane subunit [bacterium]